MLALLAKPICLQRVVLPSLDRSRRAMLLSQSGRGAGRWLSAIPRTLATTLKPMRMQVALRRRLRWPLPLGPRHCNGNSCKQLLDGLGDCWASCVPSGRVKRRSRPLERIWAIIFREAGTRVLEWLPLAFPLHGVSLWQWTRRWSVPCIVMAVLGLGQTRLPGSLFFVARRIRIPSTLFL